MKKLLFIWVLASFGPMLYSQQTVTFSPNWTIGDKHTIKIIKKDLEYENDSLIKETITREWQHDIEVISSTPQHFYLKVSYENDLITQAEGSIGERNPKFDPYRNIQMIYSIDRTTGAYELDNWEAIHDFINSMQDTIKMYGSEEVLSNVEDYRYKDFSTHFDSKKKMEEEFGGVIEPLLMPYGKEFEPNDTLETIAYTEGIAIDDENPPMLPLLQYFIMSPIDSAGISVIELITDFKSIFENIFGTLDQTLQELKLKPPKPAWGESNLISMGKIIYDTKTTWLISLNTYVESTEFNVPGRKTSYHYQYLVI